MFTKENLVKKIIPAVILLIIAVLSWVVVTPYSTSTKVHEKTIETLDEKKLIAMELTAGVAVTSSAIAAIPGDATTPISEQLSDLTGPLFLIVCALYLEKFLLTTIGYISFSILIPLSCILSVAYIFAKKDKLKNLAVKFAIFAVAIFMIIPVSVKVSNFVEKTFEDSIAQTFESVDEISITNEEEEEKKGLQQFVDKVVDEATVLAEQAKNALSAFVDAIAVLLITVCVIPIAVIFFFIWIVKMIFGININIANAKKLLPNKRKRRGEEDGE